MPFNDVPSQYSRSFLTYIAEQVERIERLERRYKQLEIRTGIPVEEDSPESGSGRVHPALITDVSTEFPWLYTAEAVWDDTIKVEEFVRPINEIHSVDTAQQQPGEKCLIVEYKNENDETETVYDLIVWENPQTILCVPDEPA